MNTLRTTVAVLAFSAALAVGGCASSGGGRAGALIPGDGVLHVVLLKLKSPGDAPEAEKDARESLAPMMRRFTAGRAFDLGRPEVVGDYDIAFVMEFDRVSDYQRYLDSGAHRAILARWKPRVASLRAVDVIPFDAR